MAGDTSQETGRVSRKPQRSEHPSRQEKACVTCHMKTDGSISRLSPRISKQDFSKIASIDLFLFLKAVALSL